jgi:hypothetical protein
MRLLILGLSALLAVGGGAAIAHATQPALAPVAAPVADDAPPVDIPPVLEAKKVQCEKSGALCNNKSWKCCSGLRCTAPNPKRPTYRVCK